MEAFETLFDFGISSPVHSVKVVMATIASPGYTPWMIYPFLDIKDGTDVVDL